MLGTNSKIMISKQLLKLLVLIPLLAASCSDKDQGLLEPSPVKPPVETEDPKEPAVSDIIKKNSTLIKTVKTDTSYSNYPGMKETYITYLDNQDKPIALYLLELDLSNENLSIEVATPNDQPVVNSVQRVSAMITAKNTSSTDKEVLAGINGDYFNSPNPDGRQIPLGPVHKQGVQVRTEMSSGYMFFGRAENGNYLIGNNQEYLTYQNRLLEVIGGRHRILTNGNIVSQSDVSVAPRTSIGVVSPTKVIMMVVDGRQANHSVGYTLQQEAEALKALGVKDAVNLDGGGSTVFITKEKNNQYKIKNKVSDGSERAVANGLLVVQKKN